MIEARTAYAAAIDAFNARKQRSDQAADADAANLAAIDAALVRLQSLDRSQLRLVQLFGGLQ